jgi:hypothetical protein
MIFGINPLMRDISAKLSKECRPETQVLSYRFALPTVGEAEGDSQELLNAEVTYDQEEMRVYRVVGKQYATLREL